MVGSPELGIAHDYRICPDAGAFPGGLTRL